MIPQRLGLVVTWGSLRVVNCINVTSIYYKKMRNIYSVTTSPELAFI